MEESDEVDEVDEEDEHDPEDMVMVVAGVVSVGRLPCLTFTSRKVIGVPMRNGGDDEDDNETVGSVDEVGGKEVAVTEVGVIVVSPVVFVTLIIQFSFASSPDKSMRINSALESSK